MQSPSSKVITPENALERITQFGGLPVLTASASKDWGVCMAIYGPGGVGKTTFAATAADSPYGGRVVFLDAEGGTRSISHRDDIDVVDASKWSNVKKFWDACKRGDIPWGTIVWDNMSELQNVHMQSIVGGNQPQIQDWGTNTREMLNLTRDYRDMARKWGINVIFIAWDSTEKDESTKITKKAVNFTPSLQEQFPGVVDIIGYLTVEEDAPHYTRVLNLAPSKRTDAKFRRSKDERAQAIPFIIPNPSMVSFLAVMKGGEKWPASQHQFPTRTANRQATPEQTAAAS